MGLYNNPIPTRFLILNYQRNEDKAKYSFLNYQRNEDEAKYSFLNYRWFDIATLDEEIEILKFDCRKIIIKLL